METSKPAWILLQNGYGLIIGFLTYLLIARDAGLAAWGIFGTALSFGLVFSFVSDLGINTAHTRMIAAGNDRNDYNNALIFMKIFLTLIYVGIIFLAIFVWTVALHQEFQSPLVYISILLLIPYFLGLPYVQANRAFFTGTQEAFKMSFPPIMESTSRFIAVLVLIRFNVFHFPTSGSGLTQMALLIAVSYSISYAVYAILSFAVGMPWRFKWPRLETIRNYLRYSYPLMGVAITSTVSANLAQVLVFISVGSYDSGGYQGVYRFILMMTGFATSVTILILPLLTSQLVSNGNYGKTMGKTVKYLTIFVTPLTVFALVFAPPILNLWSSYLIPFSLPLRIMLIGSWFWTMSIPFWTHFNATAKTGVSGSLNIFGYVLLIILDVVLIPSYLADVHLAGMGVNGAAYAYMFSGAAILIASVIALYREVKIPVTFQSIVGASISLLLGALFFYFFHTLHNFHALPAIVMVGLFLAYALAYTGLLVVSRVLSKQEFMEILSMLNIKKLGEYAVNEARKPSQ